MPRLSKREEEALTEAIKDLKNEVYLFGSRVDDSQKGDDIDLLIFSEEEPLTLSQKISRRFFEKIEAKLDVLVLDKNNLSSEQKAFLNTISTVRLK